MESERENQTPLELCQSINKETNSVNEVKSHPISTKSIYIEMTLPDSESGNTGLIK
jgi:hypothetical protein